MPDGRAWGWKRLQSSPGPQQWPRPSRVITSALRLGDKGNVLRFWAFPPASPPRREQKGDGDQQRDRDCSQQHLLPEALWARKASWESSHFPSWHFYAPCPHPPCSMPPDTFPAFFIFLIVAALLMDYSHIIHLFKVFKGFPGGSEGKESACQWRRPRFNPWRRKWQPTEIFLPGEFHGQRDLMDYSPWGRKELGRTEWLTLSLSKYRTQWFFSIFRVV